ncbi:glycosyltransferase family 4 protein [Candidatus Wolfebacteria bacterium]|nr:glycosyltransferase family 4 protein [Candidatus Wolfebacteria bacterium]
MKILFITTDLKGLGGIQKYDADFLKSLESEKVLVVESKRRDIISKIIFVLSVFLRFLTFHPDFVICGHINFAPIGNFIKKLFGKDYAVLTYGIDVWNLNKKQIECLKNAKTISTISNYTKRRILAAAPQLESKIFMLSNAINGDKFKPKQKSEELAKKLGVENNKVILTIGRFAKSEGYKGYDKVIQALPDVIKEIKNVKYVLAGKGDDVDGIKQLVKDLKMEDYVVMPGYILEEELVDYYNLCDVFIMPSKGEGFGFVFLEALACGKPVIAGNQDGSVDAVLGGEVGVLVNPDNIVAISEAIVNILKHKTGLKLLDRSYLRKKVLETYGIDKFKEKVKNLIYGLQK